jgi:hypothetical protein
MNIYIKLNNEVMCILGDSKYKKVKIGYGEGNNYHNNNGHGEYNKKLIRGVLITVYVVAAIFGAIILYILFMIICQKKPPRQALMVVGRPVTQTIHNIHINIYSYGGESNNNNNNVVLHTSPQQPPPHIQQQQQHVRSQEPVVAYAVEMIEQQPPAPLASAPPRVIDPHLLDRLNEMGFDRRDAENKLLQANAFDVVDVSRAVEIIASYS